MSKGEIVKLLEAARKTEKLVVFVTNEVGGGIVPDNVMAREYRDLAGWINQQVADVCDRVFYCVAGQAVDLKKWHLVLMMKEQSNGKNNDPTVG